MDSTAVDLSHLYINQSNRNRTSCNDKVRAVFYGRVSTQHEAQMNAMENQILWCESLLREHPNWVKIDAYWDKGVSGTSAEGRKAFMTMIDDAKAGMFDLVVTRETSRFARNTLDTLAYTRLLKKYGVEVFFCNDNIWSLEGDGELRLTIMAAMAQEESRHISDRVRSGQKTSREEGVLYGSGNILGYNLCKGIKSTDNTYEIDAEQADTVRRIFDLYLQGYGTKKIANILMQEERLTATGLKRWTVSNVSKTLKNMAYCGYKPYGKSETIDYLSHSRKVIHDTSKHVYVKADFPAIISEEDFKKAQKIRESRTHNTGEISHGKRPQKDKWTKKLRCQCGATYKKYKWRVNKDGRECIGYQCYDQVANRKRSYYIDHGLDPTGRCDIPSIPSWKLEFCLFNIIERLKMCPNQIIADLCKEIGDNYVDERIDSDIERDRLAREKAREEGRLDNLLDMRLENIISKEEYSKKFNQIQSKLSELEDKLKEMEDAPIQKDEEDTRVVDILEIKNYLTSLCNLEGAEVPEEIVDLLIERVVPSEEGVMRWYLNNSIENYVHEYNEKDYTLIDTFELDFDTAKSFRKQHGSFLRITQWKDIKIEVYA